MSTSWLCTVDFVGFTTLQHARPTPHHGQLVALFNARGTIEARLTCDIEGRQSPLAKNETG
jgi:hypothetical protein